VVVLASSLRPPRRGYAGLDILLLPASAQRRARRDRASDISGDVTDEMFEYMASGVPMVASDLPVLERCSATAVNALIRAGRDADGLAALAGAPARRPPRYACASATRHSRSFAPTTRGNSARRTHQCIISASTAAPANRSTSAPADLLARPATRGGAPSDISAQPSKVLRVPRLSVCPGSPTIAVVPSGTP